MCVGFGIGQPAQAREVARVADGVIVGSAVVRLIEEMPQELGRVKIFLGALREAIDRGGSGF